MPHLRRLFGRWLRLRRLVRWRWRERQASAPAIEATEGPLRAALYSVEQMEVYGRALARQHRVRMRPGAERLLDRLQANERVLEDANTLLSSVVREQRPVTPAGEVPRPLEPGRTVGRSHHAAPGAAGESAAHGSEGDA